MTIGLVACSKTKANHRALARDLYQGTLFRRAAAYAEQRCDAWYILSARHGLVRPTSVLEPYDAYIGDLSADQRRQWAARVTQALDAEGVLRYCRSWVVLAGNAYRQYLDLPGQVLTPLGGMGIGEQIAWLNNRLEDTSPCRICEVAPAQRPGQLCDGCAEAISHRRGARYELPAMGL
jgi:hypothetical protein